MLRDEAQDARCGSDGGSRVIDIKVGAEGDITPFDTNFQGLTFYDRGPGGQAMGCHNSTGSSWVGPYDARIVGGEGTTYPICSGTTMPSSIIWPTSPCPSGINCANVVPAISSTSVLGMLRTDGYSWGYGVIQGVRTYDTVAGNWTAPDAYGGDVDDPTSQKSYMWNGNNPVSYADPSGFDPASQGNDGSGAHPKAQPMFTDWNYTGTVGVDTAPFGHATERVITAQLQKQIDAMAKQQIQDNYANTMRTGNEHGGYIYLKSDGSLVAGPQFPVVGDGLGGGLPDSTIGHAVGWWHLHPRGPDGDEVGIGDPDSEDRGHYLSGLDRNFSAQCYCAGYVGTSDNHFVRYDPVPATEQPLGSVFP